jgi:membrane protein DedA with SNARE-associated domain
MTALASSWTDPAAIGYPVLFGGVLLGSIVPIVPTGALVGAAAAIATSTDRLNLPLVLAVCTVAALLGDLVTFAVARSGGPALTRWVRRGQPEQRLAAARTQFTERGWLLVMVGRLIPGGRIPVLLAAGALGYPWRRLVPAAAAACLLWALAYAVLGVVSGGLFDNPLVASLVAVLLILIVTLVVALAARYRQHRRSATVSPRAGDQR